MGEMGPGLSHQWRPRPSRCSELVASIDSGCSVNSQNSKGGLTLLKVSKGQNTQTQGTGHTHMAPGTNLRALSTHMAHGTDLRALDTHMSPNLRALGTHMVHIISHRAWRHTWHTCPGRAEDKCT